MNNLHDFWRIKYRFIKYRRKHVPQKDHPAVILVVCFPLETELPEFCCAFLLPESSYSPVPGTRCPLPTELLLAAITSAFVRPHAPKQPGSQPSQRAETPAARPSAAAPARYHQLPAGRRPAFPRRRSCSRRAGTASQEHACGGTGTAKGDPTPKLTLPPRANSTLGPAAPYPPPPPASPPPYGPSCNTGGRLCCWAPAPAPAAAAAASPSRWLARTT